MGRPVFTAILPVVSLPPYLSTKNTAAVVSSTSLSRGENLVVLSDKRSLLLHFISFNTTRFSSALNCHSDISKGSITHQQFTFQNAKGLLPTRRSGGISFDVHCILAWSSRKSQSKLFSFQENAKRRMAVMSSVLEEVF